MSNPPFATAMYCEYVAQIPLLHPEDTVESMAVQVATAMVNKMGPIVPTFHIQDCVFVKPYPEGTITSKKLKELPSGELYMIMTPPSGTNPVIHTLKACKTARSESERQAQAKANAERLIREESEADNQKLKNKYAQAERKLQKSMDDCDRAQSERDSAINKKAQSKHRVLMPLKEKFCKEWDRGQDAKLELLMNSITEHLMNSITEQQKTMTENFNKQLADQKKTITDLQKTLTYHAQVLADHTQVLADHTQVLADHTQVLADHTQVLSELALRNMLDE